MIHTFETIIYTRIQDINTLINQFQLVNQNNKLHLKINEAPCG